MHSLIERVSSDLVFKWFSRRKSFVYQNILKKCQKKIAERYKFITPVHYKQKVVHWTCPMCRKIKIIAICKTSGRREIVFQSV